MYRLHPNSIFLQIFTFLEKCAKDPHPPQRDWPVGRARVGKSPHIKFLLFEIGFCALLKIHIVYSNLPTAKTRQHISENYFLQFFTSCFAWFSKIPCLYPLNNKRPLCWRAVSRQGGYAKLGYFCYLTVLISPTLVMAIWHTLPVDDIEEHEESSTCKCEPEVEKVEGDLLIIHNSFDGREAVEWANDILDE